MIGASVCIIFGLLFAFGAIKLWVKGDADQDLPLIEGRLIESSLTSGAAVNRGSESRTSGFQWVLSARYVYNVEGKEYEGLRVTNNATKLIVYDKVKDDVETAPPERLSAIYKELQRSDSVMVYYSPKNPSRSFLFFEPVPAMKIFIMVVVSLLAFISGVTLFYQGKA